MNLRLTDEESKTLLVEAEHEGRSMQVIARAAIAQYVPLNDPRAGCGSTAGLVIAPQDCCVRNSRARSAEGGADK